VTFVNTGDDRPKKRAVMCWPADNASSTRADREEPTVAGNGGDETHGMQSILI
jgi:hypothetical protein